MPSHSSTKTVTYQPQIKECRCHGHLLRSKRIPVINSLLLLIQLNERWLERIDRWKITFLNDFRLLLFSVWLTIHDLWGTENGVWWFIYVLPDYRQLHFNRLGWCDKRFINGSFYLLDKGFQVPRGITIFLLITCNWSDTLLEFILWRR